MRLDGKDSASVNGNSGEPRLAFYYRCFPRSSIFLKILLCAMRMILRSTQLVLDHFLVLSDGITGSEFGSNQHQVFEAAHEA